MVPPYKPDKYSDNFDKAHVGKPDVRFSAKDYQLLKKKTIQKLFSGYDYKQTNRNFEETFAVRDSLHKEILNSNFESTCTSTK